MENYNIIKWEGRFALVMYGYPMTMFDTYEEARKTALARPNTLPEISHAKDNYSPDVTSCLYATTYQDNSKHAVAFRDYWNDFLN